MPQTFFSSPFRLSNEKLFFVPTSIFACHHFPHSLLQQSVNCVNSYKIYTMFNNNFPFKLNFSKWNRISHWLDHRARTFFFYRKIPCVRFPLSPLWLCVCVCDSKLSSEFFLSLSECREIFLWIIQNCIFIMWSLAFFFCGKIFHLHLKWRWTSAEKNPTIHRVISLLIIIVKLHENGKKNNQWMLKIWRDFINSSIKNSKSHHYTWLGTHFSE